MPHVSWIVPVLCQLRPSDALQIPAEVRAGSTRATPTETVGINACLIIGEQQPGVAFSCPVAKGRNASEVSVDIEPCVVIVQRDASSLHKWNWKTPGRRTFHCLARPHARNMRRRGWSPRQESRGSFWVSACTCWAVPLRRRLVTAALTSGETRDESTSAIHCDFQ